MKKSTIVRTAKLRVNAQTILVLRPVHADDLPRVHGGLSYPPDCNSSRCFTKLPPDEQ